MRTHEDAGLRPATVRGGPLREPPMHSSSSAAAIHQRASRGDTEARVELIEAVGKLPNGFTMG